MAFINFSDVSDSLPAKVVRGDLKSLAGIGDTGVQGGTGGVFSSAGFEGNNTDWIDYDPDGTQSTALQSIAHIQFSIKGNFISQGAAGAFFGLDATADRFQMIGGTPILRDNLATASGNLEFVAEPNLRDRDYTVVTIINNGTDHVIYFDGACRVAH